MAIPATTSSFTILVLLVCVACAESVHVSNTSCAPDEVCTAGYLKDGYTKCWSLTTSYTDSCPNGKTSVFNTSNPEIKCPEDLYRYPYGVSIIGNYPQHIDNGTVCGLRPYRRLTISRVPSSCTLLTNPLDDPACSLLKQQLPAPSIDLSWFSSQWYPLDINLYYNNITEFPMKMLCHVYRGDRSYNIDLSFNQLSKIDTPPCMLPSISGLNLAFNAIPRVDVDFATYFPDLVTLNMSNSSISTLQHDADGVLSDKLVTLDLSYNNLSSFGLSVHKGKALRLQTLNLQYNSLSVVSEALFTFTPNLTHLDLAGNLLSYSTLRKSQLYRLSYLKTFNISNAAGFMKCVDIMKLLIRFNVLCIANCGGYHMQVIDIGETNTCTLTNYLRFPNLRYLKADNNFLHDFTVGSPWPMLTDLNLNHNNLTHTEQLVTYTSLVHLQLSHNHLHSIHMRQFPWSIQTVDLSWNYISSLTGSLYHLPNLRVLNLAHNNLVKPSVELFRFPKIRPQIFLAGNKIHCDCHMDWLRNINSNRSLAEVPDLDQVICGTPHLHTDRPFTHLTSEDLVCPYHTDCDQAICRCCQSTRNCSCYASCYDECICVRKHDYSVNMMDCTSKDMSILPPLGPYYAQSIRLDGNSLLYLSATTLNFPFLVELFLNSSHIVDIEVGAFDNLREIKTVHLQDNAIRHLERLTLTATLHELYLQGNHLESIALNGVDQLSSLQLLWLHNNNLKHMNLTIFDHMKSLKHMTLHDNPWECDCTFGLPFKTWLQKNSAKIQTDLGYIHCKSNGGSQSIADKDFSYCTDSHLDVIIMAVAFVTFSAIAIVIFRNRFLIMVWAFARFGVRCRNEKDDNETKPYDVLLSYAIPDEKFVVKTLLHELENGEKSYKVCLEIRDWPGGEFTSEMHIAAVQQSKRIILFVSEKYFGNKWANYAFQAAHYQGLDDWQLRLILVVTDKKLRKWMDRDIKLYMRAGIYLVYGELNFWDKLRYYLADDPRGADHVVNRPYSEMNIYKNTYQYYMW